MSQSAQSFELLLVDCGKPFLLCRTREQIGLIVAGPTTTKNKPWEEHCYKKQNNNNKKNRGGKKSSPYINVVHRTCRFQVIQ
jgi:hypothetical protein